MICYLHNTWWINFNWFRQIWIIEKHWYVQKWIMFKHIIFYLIQNEMQKHWVKYSYMYCWINIFQCTFVNILYVLFRRGMFYIILKSVVLAHSVQTRQFYILVYTCKTFTFFKFRKNIMFVWGILIKILRLNIRWLFVNDGVDMRSLCGCLWLRFSNNIFARLHHNKLL